MRRAAILATAAASLFLLSGPAVAQVCGDGLVEGAEACDDGGTSPQDGCDQNCAIEAGFACRAGSQPSLCGSDANTGQVVINEVMQNPTCADDALGEWVEVLNFSEDFLYLKGFALADLGSDLVVVTDPIVIPDQGVAVLCRNTDPATNGGVICDGGYNGANFQLANGADEVLLLSPADTLVDQIVYDDGLTFPDPAGASMSLDVGMTAFDNDTGANWCTATVPIPGGCGDLGTPGAPNNACLVGCADADGDGYYDTACGGTDCDDANPAISPMTPEDCENNQDDDCDGLADGMDPDCMAPSVCGDGLMGWGETCDDSNLAPGDGCDDACQVEFGWSCRLGTEPSLCGNWGAPGLIFVTEIMNNPTCVDDADGEWLEIENPTLGTLELRGWSLSDGSGTYLLPGLVVPPSSFVVLCENPNPATNGGITCDGSYAGLALGNASDTLILRDATDILVDQVAWDDGATFPDPAGASMQLTAGGDHFTNDFGANWCASIPAIVGGCGDLGTPGVANPDCPACVDADNDTYDDAACGGGDCNDADPRINPGATEVCDDVIDNDCDGLTDAADPDCQAPVCGNGIISGAEACDDGNPDAGDGCSDACQVEAGWGCRTGQPSLCGTAVAAGDVVITEIMNNPGCVVDTAGEWVELENQSGGPIELRGFALADQGSDHAVLTSSVQVAAGGFALLCRNGDPGTNGGITCDGTYAGGQFTLGNAVDEAQLLDVSDTLVDGLAYDDGATFPDPSGASMSLEPGLDHLENDTGANWCEATDAIAGGCGDLGSPGAANPACPACPDADNDSHTDQACGGDDCDDANPQINPDAVEVCNDSLDNDCDGATDAADPDCPPADVCGDGIISGLEVCDDGNPNPGDGCSDACQVEGGWACVSQPSLCGNTASAGELVITEIMYNPACVTDGDGEWVELTNTSGRSLQLKGWSFADAGGANTLAADLSLADGGVAVLCRNADPVTNGGVSCDATFSVSLNNTGDTVALSDPAGGLVDEVIYNAGLGFPDPAGASLSLEPGLDASDNDDGANWCSAVDAIAGGCGDLGTPGLMNPVCPPPCVDADGDGYEDQACGGNDCDDAAGNVNPGEAEDCGNGVDDDCDGLTDLADDTCVELCGDGLIIGAEECDDDNQTDFDGCSAACTIEAGWGCAAGTEPSLCGTIAAEGDLLVTEIMNNPACVDDDVGEWIEIRNTSIQPHQLRGWTLADAGASFVLDADLVVAAGGQIVLCNEGDPLLNGNVACDLVYSGFNLNNTGDTLTLTDPGGTPIDQVVYDDGATFPDQPGAAMSLDPSADATTNDIGQYWCPAQDPIAAGCGDLGTPGAANPDCPAVCPDADGDGHADQVCGGDDCDDAAAEISPSQVEACANGIDDDCDGDVDLADPDCGAPTVCGDGAIEGQEFCDDFNALDGDGCSAECQFEAGFACVPGSEPSLCGTDAAAGEVVITEIMNDPACVNDDYGEWVELTNTSGRLIQLKAWTLGDGDGAFRLTESLQLSAGERAVLCASDDVGLNGNVPCDVAFSGFRFNNTAETVLLTDPEAEEIDRVDYTLAFPSVEGAAKSLQPGASAADNDLADNWCLAQDPIRNGCGDLGTPAAPNPICPACVDLDGDGYEDLACGGNDCDDSQASINPDADEICDDGIDQDCDGQDVACTCDDLDGDGHGDQACGGDDCDDSQATIYPGAPEICEDGLDQDCNGFDLECGCPDADLDGFSDAACGGPDCDDSDRMVRPGAEEICADGLDNDCDGLADGADPQCGAGAKSGCGCATSGGRTGAWLALLGLGLLLRRRQSQIGVVEK